MKLTVLEEESP